MRKIKEISILSGLFLLVLIAGWTFLFSYEHYLNQNNQPLPYFEKVSFATLYNFVTRQDLIKEDQALAELKLEPNYSKLDGLILPSETKEIPIAIMIDNHSNAREKHSGLAKASIVYETLAEGDITRFMAVFSYQGMERVGPVRSARPYFVRFSQEYQGGYGHAGGSPDALSLIPETGLVNLEGLYYEEIPGDYFYRDTKYYAPHNLFANLNNVKKLISQKKKNEEGLKESRFKFADLLNPEALSSAQKITLDFSDKYFLVEYTYDPIIKSYARFMGGEEHRDVLFDIPIKPTNVIVEFTSYHAYDEKGRLRMTVEGEGKALVFTSGKAIKGTWKKEGDNFTRFYDQQGEEIPLSRGQTWIEVIEGEEKVKWE